MGHPHSHPRMSGRRSSWRNSMSPWVAPDSAPKAPARRSRSASRPGRVTAHTSSVPPWLPPDPSDGVPHYARRAARSRPRSAGRRSYQIEGLARRGTLRVGQGSDRRRAPSLTCPEPWRAANSSAKTPLCPRACCTPNVKRRPWGRKSRESPSRTADRLIETQLARVSGVGAPNGAIARPATTSSMPSISAGLGFSPSTSCPPIHAVKGTRAKNMPVVVAPRSPIAL
jgi:hypothetical protein